MEYLLLRSWQILSFWLTTLFVSCFLYLLVFAIQDEERRAREKQQALQRMEAEFLRQVSQMAAVCCV